MPQSPALVTQQPLVPLISASIPDEFVDFDGRGPNAVPADTLLSALIALKKLGLDCSYNIFKNEYLISGQLLTIYDTGQVSDNTVLALRHLIRMNFNFEPSPRKMQDAVTRYCTMRTFHPIKQYLEGVPRWDGLTRADELLSTYFNAPDTPFNRAVSRIVMIASVRRIYTPGTKFDYMTVLQSPEGFNKSSAIETLYGKDNFTDQSTIGLNARDTEEVMRGHWGQENPELSGISKADWNRFKANLSRTNDRTRRVFERNPINAQRTCIPWGTTNDDTYLRALSGVNRRFFSVDVLSSIDIAQLIRDRDDLWAEAMEIEATGESCMLPEKYWDDANAERLKRTEIDPWEDTLRDISELGAKEARKDAKAGMRSPCYELTDDGEERVSSGYLFDMLGFAEKDRNPIHGSRIARVMKKQGWVADELRIGGKHSRGYRRPFCSDLM